MEIVVEAGPVGSGRAPLNGTAQLRQTPKKNHPVLTHEVAKVQGGTHPEGCVVRGRERGARPPHVSKIGLFVLSFKDGSSLSG